jgi:hypothetical protein
LNMFSIPLSCSSSPSFMSMISRFSHLIVYQKSFMFICTSLLLFSFPLSDCYIYLVFKAWCTVFNLTQYTEEAFNWVFNLIHWAFHFQNFHFGFFFQDLCIFIGFFYILCCLPYFIQLFICIPFEIIQVFTHVLFNFIYHSYNNTFEFAGLSFLFTILSVCYYRLVDLCRRYITFF